jgi:hypothetical protein
MNRSAHSNKKTEIAYHLMAEKSKILFVCTINRMRSATAQAIYENDDRFDMGHIKEPVGVDLNVGPMTFSAEDRQALSAVIAQHKLTKEVPKSKQVKVASKKKAT